MINWTYEGNLVLSLSDMPPHTIGFIYRIYNKTTKKEYFGRKTVASKGKKKLTLKEKALPENKRKIFKQVVKEYSDWKKYNGSNKLLLEHIERGDKYEKEIIHYCFSKTELTYYETKYIVCSGCLERDDCYNDWVSAKVFKKNLK